MRILFCLLFIFLVGCRQSSGELIRSASVVNAREGTLTPIAVHGAYEVEAGFIVRTMKFQYNVVDPRIEPTPSRLVFLMRTGDEWFVETIYIQLGDDCRHVERYGYSVDWIPCDVTGDHKVDEMDMQWVTISRGKAIDYCTWVYDVNWDGSINSLDRGMVKIRMR